MGRFWVTWWQGKKHRGIAGSRRTSWVNSQLAGMTSPIFSRKYIDSNNPGPPFSSYRYVRWSRMCMQEMPRQSSGVIPGTKCIDFARRHISCSWAGSWVLGVVAQGREEMMRWLGLETTQGIAKKQGLAYVAFGNVMEISLGPEETSYECFLHLASNLDIGELSIPCMFCLLISSDEAGWQWSFLPFSILRGSKIAAMISRIAWVWNFMI